MKIRFEATIDDFINAHQRAVARSNVMRSWRREGYIVTALFHGLLAGILIFTFVHAAWPLTGALIYAGAVALIVAAVSLNSHRKKVKRRLYNFYKEQFGDRESFTSEVELNERGIATRFLGTHNLFEWPNVEEISETKDAVEFFMYGGGGVILKSGYFASPDEMRQFAEVARRNQNVSRTSSNWQHAS